MSSDKKGASVASDSYAKFIEHLRQASEVVKNWPPWKQTVLGSSCASPEANAAGETAKTAQQGER